MPMQAIFCLFCNLLQHYTLERKKKDGPVSSPALLESGHKILAMLRPARRNLFIINLFQVSRSFIATNQNVHNRLSRTMTPAGGFWKKGAAAGIRTLNRVPLRTGRGSS
jgi:hypothetical protein